MSKISNGALGGEGKEEVENHDKPDQPDTKKPWKKANRYVKLPRLMAADRRLSDGAIRLAILFINMDFAKANKWHEGVVFPSLSRLADSLSISERTIMKYTGQLESCGYLQRKRRWGSSNLYIMKMPRISSVEEFVKNYRVCAYSLVIEDLDGLSEELKVEFERFFEILRGVKKNARSHRQKTGEIVPFSEIQQVALELYLEQCEPET